MDHPTSHEHHEHGHHEPAETHVTVLVNERPVHFHVIRQPVPKSKPRQFGRVSI